MAISKKQLYFIRDSWDATPVSSEEEWVLFRLEGGDLALHLDPRISETSTPARVQYGAVVSFTVRDINHTIAHAKTLGFIQPGSLQILPYGKQAELRDPWGNRISLLEPLRAVDEE